MTRIPEAEGAIDIRWDTLGVAHIAASNVADAFRGMGYACATERLWQLHLSNLYATGQAASVLGDRFIGQDLLLQAFNVPACEMPASDGDWITDAYLEGLNAYVAQLDEVPPEFQRAGTEPRRYTRHDVASRYRFTGWFQHKSWLEKIYLGHLMAAHGPEYFEGHVLRFTEADRAVLELLKDDLPNIDIRLGKLLYPNDAALNMAESASNNWALQSRHSASGAPMLATDPHQPYSIPNTFFYAHLSAPGWDAFGASFPGVPYFMMGFNRNLAWGLTTGCIDTYDVFVEKDAPVEARSFEIATRTGKERTFDIAVSAHGPVLESISDALGFTDNSGTQTSLDWVMRDLPTSSGVLSRLPIAETSEEFGTYLFEDDVCPLVNNIICVDRHDDLRRFIAATVRKRKNVSGVLPLPGWLPEYRFERSTASDLLVEHNPERGYVLTANNDTMGERGDFPIHNFPAHHSRAARIEELLEQLNREKEGAVVPADFEAMQLDLTDIKAREQLPDIIAALTEDGDEIAFARECLENWDCSAGKDSQAACIYYALLDRRWHIDFMREVLGQPAHDVLLRSMPTVAPGLNRFSIADFMREDSPWRSHSTVLNRVICRHVTDIVRRLRQTYGEDFRYGDMHQVAFRHRLSTEAPWTGIALGPDAVGGSPTTLGMATHNPPPKDSLFEDVFHGPVFRWIVDLADPLHARFVIAGGNGGRHDSPFLTNHYDAWLHGKYFDLTLVEDEIDVAEHVSVGRSAGNTS